MGNKYIINGKEYTLKEKYSSKDWGKIMLILGGLKINEDVVFGMVGQLLADGSFERLLNIILTGSEPIEEVFDDDFKPASEAINDFFTLKKNMMPTMAQSSKD